MRSRISSFISRSSCSALLSQVLETSLSRSCTVRLSHPRSKSNVASNPKITAEEFLSKFANGKPFISSQFLDANQLRLFSLTLNRPYLHQSASGPSLEDEPPKAGTPLPPFYHLAYFTPAQLPGILGLDGTDASFNPAPPFTRRMWAGGAVSWPGAPQEHYLRIGDTVTETTTVLSCDPKIIKSTGESMLVVSVLKEFRDSKDNLCVADNRSWVFREALDPSKPTLAPKKPSLLSESDLNDLAEGKHVQTFCRDEITLFRVSALTFNAHRIHYDKPWAIGVEGHRNVVVHGPLNLISMLDLWRDKVAESGVGVPGAGVVMPASIEYRATSPVYAGEGYRIILDRDPSTDGTIPVRVVSNDGTVCMKGNIKSF
jgi:hydroxyacyl-ACP dehydratase HTD2-like protein with hotdog domain